MRAAATVTAIAFIFCACAQRLAVTGNHALVDQSRNHLQESQALSRNGQLHDALQQLELATQRLREIELSLGEDDPWPADADSLLGMVLREYSDILRRMDELPEETPAWLIAEETQPPEPASPTPGFAFDPTDYDAPIVLNDRVEQAIRYYAGRARSPFSLWLDRSGRYKDMMQDILASYGLPTDLVWLALVESGFSPWAYSRAHASGPWQFIKATAKLYGLRVTWWVDERRDPVKATHAAARYLRDLHANLGSWPLALAAYNWGEGRVRRCVARERTSDFWGLRRLPRQTRNFIPRYMAATILGKNHEAFGFNVQHHPPVECETITVEGTVDLRVAADCLGVSYERIRELNPELTRWCTPPGDSHYDLRVPPGLTPRYVASLSRIRNSAPDTYAEHRVKAGESLWRISRRYGVPIAILAEVNGVRNRSRIRIGQTIMVPLPANGVSHAGRPDAKVSGSSAGYADATQVNALAAQSTAPDRKWCTIRAGRLLPAELHLRIEPVAISTRPISEG
jgi:hypothetical protein